MNLDNLRKMLGMSASVDCVAFDDGQFLGADSQSAFTRFAEEREAESALVAEAEARALEPAAALESWLSAAVQDESMRAKRYVARKLLEGLDTGGPAEMVARARAHRCRIALWR
jgi:hypothetical protein